MACGGSGGTTPGSGGSGGDSATSTGSMSTGGGGGSGGSGGGQPVLCGGIAGAMCGATEFCDWIDGSCGGDDGQGVCTPRPQGCTADCPGVCGCDGMFYCNECVAQAVGVDTSALASCMNPGQYSAYQLPTGSLRLVVRKMDTQADRCTMVYLMYGVQSIPEFSGVTLPSNWGVTDAYITAQAADCLAPPSLPMGQGVAATGGTGSMAWDEMMFVPCVIDVNVALTFSSPPAPPTDVLSAMAIDVQDSGCP